MANHPILCSGSYFATRNGMIDLEAELLNVLPPLPRPSVPPHATAAWKPIPNTATATPPHAWQEVRKAKCHKKGVSSDQGYVNYLHWAGRLPFATHEVQEERGAIHYR